MIRMLCLVAGLMSSPMAIADDAAPVGATQTEAAAVEATTEAEPATPSPVEAVEPAVEAPKTADDGGFEAAIDRAFGAYLVGPIASVFFWNIPGLGMPLVVFWLLLGATFFTVRMGFVNVRLFRHAIDLVAGKYDDEESEGEVTHFQALSAALSATVGLGNIAGVAIAVALGGPGATFWMILVGLIGMSAKFTECTLGQAYRRKRSDGRIMGGAMYYLSEGLSERGLGGLGKALAVVFCILCIGGSFGGGNAFQVSQSMSQIQTVVPFFADKGWLYGLVMTGIVGVVIIGGIQRIATVAERIVPLMCTVYVLACLYILAVNAGAIPGAFAAIIDGAFNPDAIEGGFIGVLVIGVKRAVFSNEAGVGSAAIAHAAAKVKHPVEEGVVALLEPFIDTVVVCTMTALVIVITGAWNSPDAAFVAAREAGQGGALTSLAMTSVIPWFQYVLSAAVVLFAFSTMISWSYYGERCWAWLFGDRSSMVYRGLFLTFAFLGSIVTAGNVLDFSDLMILGMAFPNILGLLLLSGKVRSMLDEYTGMLKSGAIKKTN
ncbi:MAG: alanine/glycine:cation symporter family protein [Myxococcota bacterium]|nr:alanine/glycine:cation symporter family protein [Myxococcota bacterium]